MQPPDETFTERFNRLTGQMRNAEVAALIGVTENAIRKLRSGETKSLTLARGLVLAREVGVTGWYLAFGREEPRRRR